MILSCVFMNSIMIFSIYIYIFIIVLLFRMYARVCMGGTFDRLHAGNTTFVKKLKKYSFLYD